MSLQAPSAPTTACSGDKSPTNGATDSAEVAPQRLPTAEAMRAPTPESQALSIETPVVAHSPPPTGADSPALAPEGSCADAASTATHEEEASGGDGVIAEREASVSDGAPVTDGSTDPVQEDVIVPLKKKVAPAPKRTGPRRVGAGRKTKEVAAALPDSPTAAPPAALPRVVVHPGLDKHPASVAPNQEVQHPGTSTRVGRAVKPSQRLLNQDL